MSETSSVQVYNNNPGASVWKNYTSRADPIRGSIARLSTEILPPVTGTGGEISAEHIMRAKYRETAVAATEIEGRLNRVQSVSAWTERTQDVLARIDRLCTASEAPDLSENQRAELQGQFESLQVELRRITRKSTEESDEDGGNSQQPGSRPPEWRTTLCDPETILMAPENLSRISAAAETGKKDVADSLREFASRMQNDEAELTRLRSTAENLRATGNRIANAELAMGETRSAGYSIITQVGTAMLAQANAIPREVINLMTQRA